MEIIGLSNLQCYILFISVCYIHLFLFKFIFMKLNINFINYLKNTILSDPLIGKFYNKVYSNTRYRLFDILNCIIFVLKTGISWRNLNFEQFNLKMNWRTIYFHFMRFSKHNIFKKTYLKLRDMFSAKNRSNVQIIDSSFVLNKYGKNFIARNKFFKNKNCNKISLVTDENGIPLSVLVKSGNEHDLSFFKEHIDDLIILNQHKHINMLADKGYESSKHRELLINNNYTLIIPAKKNMKKVYFFDKELYKKRLRVEHAFQRIKAYRRVACRYDKLLTSFNSFLYMAASILLFKVAF